MKSGAKKQGITLEEYQANLANGLAWCTAGQHWRFRNEFGKHAGRWKGLSQSCKECLSWNPLAIPFTKLKKEKLAEGLKWCNGCAMWVSTSDDPMSNSRCRACNNRRARKELKTNVQRRKERRQHSRTGKRHSAKISVAVQDFAIASTEGLCKYCGELAMTFDHVIPVSKGGSADADNIVLACVSCNSSKGNKDLNVWLASRSVK